MAQLGQGNSRAGVGATFGRDRRAYAERRQLRLDNRLDGRSNGDGWGKRPTPGAPDYGPCGYCQRIKRRPGKTCGRRSCPGYLPVWLGDQRMRLWANLMAYGGDVILVTITAPSMPWDPTYCGHGEGVKCSGRIGCRVEAERARLFNVFAPRAHTSLHRAASEAVRRRHGSGVLRRLAYAPELQARGVLHWHVVLGVATVAERAAARHYVNELHRLAPAYGYGFVDRGRAVKFNRQGKPVRWDHKPIARERAAHYLSKYMTKETAGGIGELVVRQEAPERIVYVERKLTAITRVTTRNLRLRRAIYVQWKVSLPCDQCEAVFELMQAFDGELVYPDVADANAPPAVA